MHCYKIIFIDYGRQDFSHEICKWQSPSGHLSILLSLKLTRSIVISFSLLLLYIVKDVWSRGSDFCSCLSEEAYFWNNKYILVYFVYKFKDV